MRYKETGSGQRLTARFLRSGQDGFLAGFADALQSFIVDGELAFLLQAVFESGAEGVESGALLGLKELLLDLVLLLGEIFGQNGLMGDDFVDHPGASELRGSADLSDRKAEGGFELMARAKIGY